MLNALVFKKKWLYIIVVIILLGCGIWRVVDEFLYLEQDIIRREKVGELSTLIITESNAVSVMSLTVTLPVRLALSQVMIWGGTKPM